MKTGTAICGVLLASLAAALLGASYCQAQSNKHALDFESPSQSMKLPEGWEDWGNYPLVLDTKCRSGRKALLIRAPAEGGSFGTAARRIEGTFEGDSIRLEGFIKVKDVSEGYAGLLLRIEGGGNTLAFDNMDHKKLSGTSDWKKYVVTLPYPKEAEVIYVGAVMVGKGEAWFDDLRLSIDGNEIEP